MTSILHWATWIAAGAAVACGFPARGAELAVEQAIGSVSLDGPRARGVKPSPDGKLVAYLKADPAHEGISDLWVADSRGAKPFLLVAGKSLETSERSLSGDAFERRERMRITTTGVTEYMWDDDSRRVLIPSGEDIWIVDVGTRKLVRVLGKGGDQVDVRFSPAATRLSFVRARTLYVPDIASSATRPSTTHGSCA